MKKISQIPKSDRPREKLFDKGSGNLKDFELLAILLGSGQKGENVLEFAKGILNKYSKKGLFRLSCQELSGIKGIGLAKACIILASFELAKRTLKIKEEISPQIISVQDVIAQAAYLRVKKREHFLVLYLNGRNELISKKAMFIGTLNANLVHPRDIFAEALRQNAASVIFVHNHPSGNPDPSGTDLKVTKRLTAAGEIMGIDVLDHVIIAKNKAFSFKEQKLI